MSISLKVKSKQPYWISKSISYNNNNYAMSAFLKTAYPEVEEHLGKKMTK